MQQLLPDAIIETELFNPDTPAKCQLSYDSQRSLSHKLLLFPCKLKITSNSEI
jgi:hypothetical protein